MAKLLLLLSIAIFAVLDVSDTINMEDIRTKSIFDIAFDFMKGKGTSLLEIEDLVPEDGKEALYELIEYLDHTDDQNVTRPSCPTCKAFFTAAKSAAAIYEWEEVRDTIVNLCHVVFTNYSEEYVRTEVLCPGAIDIQGPHVYEIVRPKYRKTPERICITLNACIAPRDETSMLSDASKKDEQSYMRRPGVVDRNTAKHKNKQKSLAERKEAALKVVQFADIHIEPKYAEGSSTDCGLYVCCDPAYGEGDAGLYGDYKCNIPQRTMEVFLRKAREIQPNFIIYSGDTPPHSFWDETLDTQLNCSGILIESLANILGGFSIYPSLGNHEMYPTNLYSMEYIQNYTAPMNEEFVHMWTPFANFTDDNKETMRTGGYYSILARPGLRIISFNTLYWYTYNWYNVLHEDSSEIEAMVNFMRTSFAEARENNEKVIVVGHHPPGDSDDIVIYTRKFEDLLDQYGDLIIMQVAGHTHNDHFRMYSNGEGIPVSMTFINPSVTTKTDMNPSMRIYFLDETTYELIDYEQHGFKLDELMVHDSAKDGEPNITFVYSAMEEYGLQDMSPQSWRDLIDRMETDEELFARYFNNYKTGFKNTTCDAECHVQQICSCKYYSFDDYVYCLERNNPIAQPSTTVDETSGGHQLRVTFATFIAMVLVFILQ